MGLKAYFTGKSGKAFWLNVVAAAVLLIAIPIAAFWALGRYTHHGEKVEVPDVTGSQAYDASRILQDCGLVAVISDSDFVEKKASGSVLVQLPRAGSEVKSGRIIYLTINRSGHAPVRMPDLIRNVTVRIAERQLQQLGFRLTPVSYVEGEPKDLVIGIKQGMNSVYGGDMVNIDRALTIVAGAGIVERDSLEVDSFAIEEDEDIDLDLEL